MKKIQLINSTEAALTLILEPFGARFPVGVGEIVCVVPSDDEPLDLEEGLSEITMFSNNCIALWVNPNAIVMKGSEIIYPYDERDKVIN